MHGQHIADGTTIYGTAMLLLSLLGIAIGLTTVNAGVAAQGSLAPDTGWNSAIWAGVAAILAFLLDGYVAGRTAAVHERGWVALNGALVFLLALPLLLWLVSQALGGILGNASTIAQGLHINLGQLQGVANQAGQAVTNITPAQAQQAADAARTTAWGTLSGLLLALGASAPGGTLGARMHELPLGSVARVSAVTYVVAPRQKELRNG